MATNKQRFRLAGKMGTLYVREGLWIADNSNVEFHGMRGYSKKGYLKKVM